MEQIQFAKGFNDGFILATYEQNTAKQLSGIPQHSSYAIGLASGIAEVQKEINLLQEFNNIRTQSFDKGILYDR